MVYTHQTTDSKLNELARMLEAFESVTLDGAGPFHAFVAHRGWMRKPWFGKPTLHSVNNALERFYLRLHHLLQADSPGSPASQSIETRFHEHSDYLLENINVRHSEDQRTRSLLQLINKLTNHTRKDG